MKKAFLALLMLCLALPALAAEKETVFERVTKTGTIKCGYALWVPILDKDAKTGEIKGMVKELMEEIGKRLSLKIDWAEESGWGTIVEGLHTGRYDMICAGLAISSARAKFIDFSTPLFFTPAHLITRHDDTRFDKNYDALNDPKNKIAVLDGEMSSILARQLFPQASLDSLSQTADYSLLLKEVETKKADASIIEPTTFMEYNEHNPGLLKIANRDNPLNVFPASLGLPLNDPAFKGMIDVTLKEMMHDGTIKNLIKKYEKYPGTMFLPSPDYIAPGQKE